MVTAHYCPSRVRCSHCHRRRVVTQELCEHCDAKFAEPKMNGTEILVGAFTFGLLCVFRLGPQQRHFRRRVRETNPCFGPPAEHAVVRILTLARDRGETFGEPERAANFFVNRVRSAGKQVQQFPSRATEFWTKNRWLTLPRLCRNMPRDQDTARSVFRTSAHGKNL